MFDPESFATTSQCCGLATASALQNYGHLIRWRTASQDTAMDVGCGPGNLTVDVMYPVLGDKCSTIYAVDISEDMVDYCKEKYSSMEKFTFLKMDVESPADIQSFIDTRAPVDHVMASFFLHWLVDQDQGLRNIFDLLRPGGDLFSVHLHSNLTFFMHEHVQKSPKWGSYFKDLNRHTPTSTTENHTESDLHDILARCGFVDTFVKLTRSTWTLDRAKLTTLTRSVHVQINNIPEDRLDEYMEDYIDLGIEKNLIRVKDANSALEFDFNVFIAFGRRPE